MPESLSYIERALHQVQRSQHALQGQAWTHLRSEATDLAMMDDVAAADAISSWLLKYSDALRLLLRAAANTPDTATQLAPAMLRLSAILSKHNPTVSAVAQVLHVALPTLSPALRSVALAQHPSLYTDALTAGQDYVDLPIDGTQTWPHDRNFPPLESISGRQARLQYLGHPLTDALGSWGISSQAALVRYQIASALPALGQWSADLLSTLDNEAIGKMCMNRDDPSTVFSGG